MDAPPKDQSRIATPGPAWAGQVRLLDRMHNLVAVCFGSRVAYLNPAGIRLLGLPGAETGTERDFLSFLHSDQGGMASMDLQALADQGNAISTKLVRQDRSDVEVEMWASRLDEKGQEVYLIEAHDVSGHLRSARALRSRLRRLEGIINTVADGIITVDDRAIIQTFNPAAEEIFGFTKDEVIGRNIRSLIPEASPTGPENETGWVQTLADEAQVTGKRKGGGTVPLEVAIREMHHGEQLSFTGIVRDVSARKEAEDRIFYMAHHDALTDLPNRHLFGDRVEEAFKRAKRHGYKAALLFVDLDRFKHVNDTYGHPVGDEVLKELAQRLNRGARSTDTVARIGGDEFMMLLEELKDRAEAEHMRAKIVDLLTYPVAVAGVQVVVGASIGIAIYPDDGEDVRVLMNVADQDMYRAKSAHQN